MVTISAYDASATYLLSSFIRHFIRQQTNRLRPRRHKYLI
jgi:hypothetical protein